MPNKDNTFVKYTPEFKLKAVKAYLFGTEGGYKTVAKQYGLRSSTQLFNWTRRYRAEGAESLSEDRRTGGNNPMLGKYRRDPNVENWTFQQQIEYLKMENAILKKVKALRLKNSGEPSDT